MFSESVVLPWWQLALLLVLATLFLLDRLLLPSMRWMIRRKVNRVITEISDHLQIGIRPFQLTKRKVLIDRLVFDPMVLATMDEYAREHIPGATNVPLDRIDELGASPSPPLPPRRCCSSPQFPCYTSGRVKPGLSIGGSLPFSRSR